MGHHRVAPLPRHPDREVQALAQARAHRAVSERESNAVDEHTLLSSTGAGTIVIAASSSLQLYHTLGHEADGFSYTIWSASGVVNGSVRRLSSDKDSITLQNDATVEVTLKVKVW